MAGAFAPSQSELVRGGAVKSVDATTVKVQQSTVWLLSVGRNHWDENLNMI